MDLDLIIGSGILYFLFLFIYGHYSLNTCLIWDEIKALVKSSFCFYIALLVLVPKSTGYERRMHLTIMVASMFIYVYWQIVIFELLLENSLLEKH